MTELQNLCLQLTKKAIVVYPNSGEVWDGRAKRWLVSQCYSKSFYLQGSVEIAGFDLLEKFETIMACKYNFSILKALFHKHGGPCSNMPP